MNMPNQEVIIGIDLGTTNSEVAIIKEGKNSVIKVDGSKIVPSVVSLNSQGEILIGQSAVNNELVSPTQTIRWVKRKMGEEEIIHLGGKEYTPAMVSSLILKRLKLAAEDFLKHPVNKAVITVPAFFNEKQREATKEAALLAGLEPVKLLNEPTAAALAYSLGSKKNENWMIYDLGGGTFDVSIVNLSSEVMEVKASHGDTALGGSDFDKMIAEKMRDAFIKEQGIDLAQNPLAWARILRASESAKIRLSTQPSVKIVEEFIASKEETPLHLTYELTRTAYENMIRPSIERTLDSVRTAIERSSLAVEEIDRVILVGGATYTPLVSQILENELKISPQTWIDPSLVVAIGAAIEGANLGGVSIGPMMVDITPHSLGTSCIDVTGDLYNHILIRRNTPLPCSASNVFYKVYDDQDRVTTEVYQGESKEIHQNRLLGKFTLDGLSDSPGQDIHILYKLDRSGLLQVSVTDISTGKKGEHILKKVANSRVRHANLADLDSVKIEVSQVEEHQTGQEDDWIDLEEQDDMDQDSSGEELEESKLVSFDQIEKISIEGLQTSVQKAQRLLDEQRLDSADKQELSEALEKARTGDHTAIQKLADLVYFLE